MELRHHWLLTGDARESELPRAYSIPSEVNLNSCISLCRAWRLCRPWTAILAWQWVCPGPQSPLVWIHSFQLPAWLVCFSHLLWSLQGTRLLTELTLKGPSTSTPRRTMTTPASSLVTRTAPASTWSCGSRQSRRTGRPPRSELLRNLAFSSRYLSPFLLGPSPSF